MEGEPPSGDYFIRSLARGLRVIRAFSQGAGPMTLSEVSRAADLTRAAVRRSLLTLVDLGYVRTDGKTFQLTPRVLDLGYAYLARMSLPTIAIPHLERLVKETAESSSLAVYDDGDVLYVSRVATQRIMTMAISVGTRIPAYATSMGHVLLTGLNDEALEAYLSAVEFEPFTEFTVSSADELRRRLAKARVDGYAIVDQELEQGIRSVSAPVRNRDGDIIAAINISFHVDRVEYADAKRRFVPLLLDAAAEIGKALSST